MNPRARFAHRFASGAFIALAIGCAESSVGVAPCVKGEDGCGKQPLGEGGAPAPPSTPPEGEFEEVEMEPLTELSPSWIKSLPAPGGAIPDANFNSPILDSDLHGNLVYFYRQQSNRTLYVIPIDDDGNGGENIPVPKPTDWNMYPSPNLPSPHERPMHVEERGPTLRVSWVANCGADTCTKTEKLFYGDDINAPPSRSDLTEDQLDDVLKDADGNLYLVRGDSDSSVTKLEAETGRMLWTQSDFVSGSYFEDNDFTYKLAGAPLDDGRFVAVAHAVELPAAAFTVQAVSFIDPDGTVSRLDMPLDEPGASLLNAKDHAVYLAGSSATGLGDLTVMRLFDATHYSGVRLLRDDYTSLYPEASAVDPSGNVYVGMHSGSRRESKPTLCKLPLEGGGTCYTLPAMVSTSPEEKWSFHEIVARDNGELFIHAGSQLVHLKYPE